MFVSAAQMISISSMFGMTEIGTSVLRIRKDLILHITCSTKIHNLAILFVLLTSSFPICAIPRFPGGTYSVIRRAAHSSEMLNPLSHITDEYGGTMSRKPVRTVIYLSEILPVYALDT